MKHKRSTAYKQLFLLYCIGANRSEAWWFKEKSGHAKKTEENKKPTLEKPENLNDSSVNQLPPPGGDLQREVPGQELNNLPQPISQPGIQQSPIKENPPVSQTQPNNLTNNQVASSANPPQVIQPSPILPLSRNNSLQEKENQKEQKQVATLSPQGNSLTKDSLNNDDNKKSFLDKFIKLFDNISEKPYKQFLLTIGHTLFALGLSSIFGTSLLLTVGLVPFAAYAYKISNELKDTHKDSSHENIIMRIGKKIEEFEIFGCKIFAKYGQLAVIVSYAAFLSVSSILLPANILGYWDIFMHTFLVAAPSLMNLNGNNIVFVENIVNIGKEIISNNPVDAGKISETLFENIETPSKEDKENKQKSITNEEKKEEKKQPKEEEKKEPKDKKEDKSNNSEETKNPEIKNLNNKINEFKEKPNDSNLQPLLSNIEEAEKAQFEKKTKDLKESINEYERKLKNTSDPNEEKDINKKLEEEKEKLENLTDENKKEFLIKKIEVLKSIKKENRTEEQKKTLEKLREELEHLNNKDKNNTPQKDENKKKQTSSMKVSVGLVVFVVVSFYFINNKTSEEEN
jgi:hypothetical protein